MLLVLVDSHRQSAWLAASLGLSRATAVASLAFAIAIVHLAATVLALIAAALVCRPDAPTFALLAGTSIIVAIGSALGETRALLGAEHTDSIAQRTVSGAVLVGAASVFFLGTFGIAGVLAVLAAGALALGTVRP